MLGCQRPPSGGVWTEVAVVEAEGVDFWDVSVTGDRAVAVGVHETGRGAALVIDGNAWTVIDAPELPELHTVFAAAPDDVWAGSIDATSTPLWRWDGTSWSTVELADGVMRVRDVWGTGRDDVWIATEFDRGIADRARAYHWNGSALTEYRDFSEMAGLTDESLTSLFLYAGCSRTDSDAWLVGVVMGDLECDGFSFHFDGEVWRAYPIGVSRDIVCLEPDTLSLEPADGVAVARWQSSMWETSSRLEEVYSPCPANAASLDGAAGAVWITGDEGSCDERSPQVWRLDGGTIRPTLVEAATRSTSGVAPLLRALYETSAGTVQALGADGLVLEYQGD